MQAKNPLGKNSNNPDSYCPELLFAIERTPYTYTQRDQVFGSDSWHSYEFSWLNSSGLPQVRYLIIEIDSHSNYIVESKSLKLYLQGFNTIRQQSEAALLELLKRDLSRLLKHQVSIEILPLTAAPIATEMPGLCLEQQSREVVQRAVDLAAAIQKGQPSQRGAALATATNQHSNKDLTVYCSHLFRSLCPVTSQPDWATLIIQCRGESIELSSLLGYLLSFRQYKGFHETCVETIFDDIGHFCQPQSWSVQALFARRGGIDIDPFRSSTPDLLPFQERTIR